MQAFKSSIEAKFKNSSLIFIENTNILGIELNEGISIPFNLRLDFITDKRLNLAQLKGLLSEEITVNLKQVSSDPLVLKSYSRSLHGLITAYEEHGLYNRGVGSSAKMYKYSLTIMPEIIRLANSGKQRSFTDSSVIDVIKSVLEDHGIDCDCDTANLWTEKPEFNTLVFTQSDESDLDFINNLCSDFGINYSIEFNEESNKNKVVFSRGYITGTQFADKSLTVKLNPASPSFFDEHTLEDIVSSGDMFNAEKTDDKQQDYTYAFNFLLNDTDSEKNRKDIVEFCQKSKKALKENLCDKTIIRANDLNYAPGAILSVPDYDDKSNYTVARAHLKLYSLGEDPAKSEYSLLQTVLCVNGKNPDILGAVNRIPRISLESRPSDIEITPSSSAKTNERSSSTGDNGTVFCVGTVCDESGDSTSTSDKTYVPAKGGDGSVPTKFYLKVDDNDKPVIVHYLNSKAGTSDYLSDFPKLGQKVVAIKTGGSYLFYAYLPGGNSLDVIPLSVRNYQINAKTIYEQANSAGHAVDQDINNQGISVTQFDSMKDRIFATILQGSIDSFIDACVFRFNDLELYNRYTSTVKVKLSDNSEVSCSEGVKKLLPKLKDSRNAYLLEKEKQNSADLENKKKALSNVYSDLYAVSEKIVEIVGKDKLEDNKPIAVTDITSSGDTDIKANQNVTISGDTITLKAKTIKLEADGPKGVSIDADYSLALNTVSSSIELNPRKIDMGVKRCYIADLPYDSSLSIGQGISLSAVNVKIDSLLSASMSDGFGASVKAAKGKASMSGMDLAVKTISSSDALINIRDIGVELLEFLNFASELKKSNDPNKNGAAKVGVTTTKRLVKAACEIFDKYHDIKDAIGKETEGDMLVKATDWIIFALDVLSLAYDIVETIVVVHLHKNPAEKYKNRVKQAGYMSPQDWVKFSFFMLKTTLATIAAIDKNIVYYSSMANNKGSISVTPKKITIEAPDVETKDKTSSSNAGPLMGTNAPAVNTGSNVRPVVSGGNVSGGSSSAP